jgi:hypothetical protein
MNTVREVLASMNQAWQRGDFNSMKPLLDENVVMRGPKLKQLLRGRDAFVESYVDFMRQSRLLEYSESGHEVDMWGEVAAICYDWKMTYEQKGATRTDEGEDMFVFNRSAASRQWIALERVILF